MNVITMKDVPKKPHTGPLFTGEDVTVQPLIPRGGDYNMSIVNFGKGVRNKFHMHESDQILIVTSGKGIVATEQEQRTVTAAMLSYSRKVKNIGMVHARIRNFHIFS